MNITYEHHHSIRQDKLCPFKLLVDQGRKDASICNWHANIEVLLVTCGSGVMQYGGEYLNVKEGDVIVVNSGTLHCLNEGYSIIGLIIDNDFCLQNGIDTSKYTYEKCFSDEGIRERLNTAKDRLIAYSQDPTPENGARSRLSVLDFLIELTVGHSAAFSGNPEGKKASEEYVKTVIKYLNSHYTEPTTLDELSELCGITKFHLSREFKRYTGGTIVTYINMLKCKRAESAILEGMSVSDAAFESGFESLSYFSRTYKKLLGYPPSANVKKR